MMQHMDYLRKVLLLEPRGYPCQNANYVFRTTTTNNNDDDDGGGNGDNNNENHSNILQYVIAEQNQIYPLMSGHNTIAVATTLLECGIIPMEEPITKFTLEAPAGLINIVAKCHEGKAKSITLTNTPSFVEYLDLEVHVPKGGIGKVKVDVAYGGMWYAIVDLKQFTNHPTLNHLRLKEEHAFNLCRIGEMIKVSCREQYPVQHPIEDYPGVDILAFRDTTTNEEEEDDNDHYYYSRNTVVMSNNKLDWEKPETWTGMLDRSPCGTGTCAIMAVLHARGELVMGERFVHESIVGTKFIGTILEETTIGKKNKIAIIPQIEGSAYITQYSEVVVDDEDPFPEGYRVADIW
eukprot:CAMPEP_0194140596 /NCGR_PEP_ID=MMETSP0152-20130528/10133_1 /TAXON_ID=1049557 /ORGANISM="Thalassiothrix antarctica, Strain L6-D1" /LENGTH=348 /DNA_ID=CAMNT_0038838907 /DNA_START=276 /DNA_END=1322 /DNA_ORIENTATION=+